MSTPPARQLLLVEDDPVAAQLMQAQLASPECGIRLAASRAAALACCREQHPDLLLLDHSLPDGTAEQLLDDLAALPGGCPPFIIVTGAGDEQLAVAMMKRGARDYLVKTTRLSVQLAATVARVLRELSAEDQLSATRRALQQSTRRLEAIFESSYAGIILVSREGTVLFANRRAAEMFAAVDLVGLAYPQLVDPQQQAEGTQRMRQLIAGEIDHVLLERLYLRRDGSRFWGLLSGRRLLAENGEFEALVGIITDISDRRQAEERLQESQRLLLQAQELGKIASFDWDLASGRIGWTPQGYALLERAPATLQQTIAEWLGFVHPEDRSRLQTVIDTLLAGEVRAEVEYRLLMPDGRAKPVVTFGEVQRGGDGTPQRIVGMTQDLTERKQVERHLAEARDRAEAASRAKSEFLANMSHELRTPLNGILGMLQLLELGTLDEEQREYARIAASSGWSLLRLIDDLLDLSRIEAGRLTLREEPLDLHALLAETLALFLQAARGKGVALGETVAASVPPLLVADATRLRQILFNLVGNAVKFTGAGAVRVFAACAATGVPGRLRLRLVVSDNGCGMSAEMLERVGEPFSQEEGVYRRQHQGAGLGLSIVKRLATLMHGEMHIASRVGEGTEVTVELEVGDADTLLDPAAALHCRRG